MVTVRNHKPREVNSVLPADPEAPSHAETQPTKSSSFFRRGARARRRASMVERLAGPPGATLLAREALSPTFGFRLRP